MACYLGLQLGEATAYALKSGLTRLQTQVRLLHELPDQVELLAMLCGQMEALTMFCNHFWSVKITGCVPLQDGATGWLLLGRAMGWIPQLLLGRGGGGGGGLSGYAPSPDSAAGWTQCSGETQGRASCGFRLFSAIRWSCRLCPVGGWGHKLGFLITVDL